MALFNMLMNALGAPETGNSITNLMQSVAAPNSMMGQQRAQQQLQQASIAYFAPNTDPRTKAQAASALMQSGVSLADLAKYEEQQRIGQFQQGSLEALKNWQQGQNQPQQPAPQAPMIQGGNPAQPMQQPAPQMPAQPTSSLKDLAPLLLNPQTAGFAQQVLKQEQDAANRAFEMQKFQAEQQRQSPEAKAAAAAAEANAKAEAELNKTRKEDEAMLKRFNTVSQEALNKLSTIPAEKFGAIGGRISKITGDADKQVLNSKLQDMVGQIRILSKYPASGFSDSDAERLAAVVGGQVDIDKGALNEIISDMQARFNAFQNGNSPNTKQPAQSNNSGGGGQPISYMEYFK